MFLAPMPVLQPLGYTTAVRNDKGKPCFITRPGPDPPSIVLNGSDRVLSTFGHFIEALLIICPPSLVSDEPQPISATFHAWISKHFETSHLKPHLGTRH